MNEFLNILMEGESIQQKMKKQIQNKIEELLSKEFYCSVENLNEKNTIFSVNKNAQQPYIKILAYRNCVVICTSENLYSKVHQLLQNKNRDEIFELPLVYGQTIHYVPDDGAFAGEVRACPGQNTFDDCTGDSIELPDYEYKCLFYEDILSLRGLTGFENSLAFDENGLTETKAVFVARDNQQLIGVAGAAESSMNGVWEVGIDVKEEYRKAGLGTCLVKKLTKELLMRNIIPFYSASTTNIGSQMVAARCGYIPCWVDTFGTILDGSSVYNNLIQSFERI